MHTAMMRLPTGPVAVFYRYDALARCRPRRSLTVLVAVFYRYDVHARRRPRRSPTVPVAVFYRYDALATCRPRRSPTVPVAVFYRYYALFLTPGRQDMSITAKYYAAFIDRAIRWILYITNTKKKSISIVSCPLQAPT